MSEFLDSLPGFLRRSPQFHRANEFAEAIEPGDGIEYTWVLDYAKEEYARQRENFLGLDDKADAIIKYLGGGAGLFAVGVIAKIDADNAPLVVLALPAIVAALLSVLCAILVRMPRFTLTLPSIEGAVHFANRYGTEREATATFLGQWHLTCEGIYLATMRKTRLMTWATWLYLAALALLLIPIVAAVSKHWESICGWFT